MAEYDEQDIKTRVRQAGTDKKVSQENNNVSQSTDATRVRQKVPHTTNKMHVSFE